jgi:glutathione S-transferase
MKLIGMLDSPYVRRVAISLQLLGLKFEHRALSVFRNFDEFKSINPVVKAPTFVCDDGTVLMDSTLILEYAEALARPRSLMPRATADLPRALRITGLALAAVDKSVQVIYEQHQRPPEKLFQGWVDRATGQMLGGLAALEAELAKQPLAATREGIDQAGITTAITWHFIQAEIPALAPAAQFPKLAAFSAAAEALPEFRAAPHGLGTYSGL